jgi:hypothetical protein
MGFVHAQGIHRHNVKLAIDDTTPDLGLAAHPLLYTFHSGLLRELSGGRRLSAFDNFLQHGRSRAHNLL